MVNGQVAVEDKSGQPRSKIALEGALSEVENAIVKCMLTVPPLLFVQLPTIRDVLKEAIVLRGLTEGRQVGWFNPDSKRFCYMDEKALHSETTQGYTQPVYPLVKKQS